MSSCVRFGPRHYPLSIAVDDDLSDRVNTLSNNARPGWSFGIWGYSPSRPSGLLWLPPKHFSNDLAPPGCQVEGIFIATHRTRVNADTDGFNTPVRAVGTREDPIPDAVANCNEL